MYKNKYYKYKNKYLKLRDIKEKLVLLRENAYLNRVQELREDIQPVLNEPTEYPEEDMYAIIGRTNPDDITNEYRTLLVQHPNITPKQARINFRAPYNKVFKNPVFTFNRGLNTQIKLDDKRTINVGGVQEEVDDPDYFIYNDIIVLDRNNNVTIYAYPEEIFPCIVNPKLEVQDDFLIITDGARYKNDGLKENMKYHKLTDDDRSFKVDLDNFIIHLA